MYAILNLNYAWITCWWYLVLTVQADWVEDETIFYHILNKTYNNFGHATVYNVTLVWNVLYGNEIGSYESFFSLSTPSLDTLSSIKFKKICLECVWI